MATFWRTATTGKILIGPTTNNVLCGTACPCPTSTCYAQADVVIPTGWASSIDAVLPGTYTLNSAAVSGDLTCNSVALPDFPSSPAHNCRWFYCSGNICTGAGSDYAVGIIGMADYNAGLDEWTFKVTIYFVNVTLAQYEGRILYVSAPGDELSDAEFIAGNTATVTYNLDNGFGGCTDSFLTHPTTLTIEKT